MIEVADRWTMRSGSCVDEWEGMSVLASNSVDVTITDPPYEYAAHMKGKRQNLSGGSGYDGKPRVIDQGFAFGAMTDILRQLSASEIARVTRKAALVFCQEEGAHLWRDAFDSTALEYRRCIPWVKPDAMPSLHGRWPGQAFEAILLFMRPGATVPVGGKARYYSYNRERGDARAHDTAKPIRLMRQMVEDFTEPDEVVLDCFAGSATTGVACIAEGRRFLGWELLDGTVPVEVPIMVDGKATGEIRIEYPEYFQTSCARLRGQTPNRKAGQTALSFPTQESSHGE